MDAIISAISDINVSSEAEAKEMIELMKSVDQALREKMADLALEFNLWVSFQGMDLALEDDPDYGIRRGDWLSSSARCW